MEKRRMGVYLHIPFCVRKCDYCDFLSWPAGRESQRAYVKALEREIEAMGRRDFSVASVFFGGGTPSLLPGEWIAELMERLRQAFYLEEAAEISLEANPGTLDREKLEQYRRAGINRLSLGCQSADDRELRRLGRIHTYGEFLESYRLVREAGFSNINVDLMSGLPGQTAGDWRRSLERIAELLPEHISAYSLIVEEGTPFASERLELPSEEEERAMYECTGEVLGERGYCQYEISNYARPGFACRHNEGYWRRRPYLGLGLGAASLFGERRYSNTCSMERYLKESGTPEHIWENREILGPKEQMEEFCFLGLRMTEGVSKKEFERLFGRPFREVYGPVADRYAEMGLLWEDGERVALTRRGISVSNRVMADFLLD